MAGFRPQLVSAVNDALCDIVSTVENANEIYKNTFDLIRQSPLQPSVAPFLFPLFTCDRPFPQPAPPPFTGGQCQNVAYDVTTVATLRTRDDPNFSQPNTRTDRFTGIIGGIQFVPGSNEQGVRLFYTPPSGVLTYFNVYGTGGTGYFDNIAITNVVRVDGLPDNCGNPPPLPINPPPPNGNVREREITYDNSDGGTSTVNVTLIAGNAFINVNAEVIVPVTVNLENNLTVTANLNVSTGGISFSPGGNSGKPRYPDGGCFGDGYDPTQPDETPPPSPEDPSEDDDTDNEEVIVGALVTTTLMESGKPTQIFQSGNPDIFAPYLGFINFLIRVGDVEGAGWTSDIPIKNRRQFIPCPWAGGAIAVDGTPLPGVEWVIIPIRKTVKTPTPFI